MHEIPFLFVDKKIISPHIEWCILENVLVCTQSSSKLAQKSWYLKFMLYHAVI